MRTLVVEDLDELVEAGLLQKVLTRGLGGFFFQGEMHPFMAAILLRVSGLDPFDTDSEPEPPDRELAQIKQGVGGREGHAVIAADVRRQATILKKPLKHGESAVFFGGRERLAGQQIPAGMIGDRQWVAVFTIPQQELALVIRAPELIGVLAEG